MVKEFETKVIKLILNETPEEEYFYLMNKSRREKNVKIALAINSLNGVSSSNYCKKLLADYIAGKIEPEKITKKLIEKYSLN